MPPLDPRVLAVVRSSAVEMARYESAFIRQLHSGIAPLVPELDGDGWAFCERMVRSLLWAATAAEPPQVVAGALRWVGGRNWLEGFPDARYVDVAHALVRAVRDFSGDSWSSVGSAWVSYFLWAEPYLLAGAQQAAAERAATQRAADQRAAARLEAARQAAAQAHALLQDPRRSRSAADVDLEVVADLLDDEDEDEDEDDRGYRQIMVSMTRNPRREAPRHPGT